MTHLLLQLAASSCPWKIQQGREVGGNTPEQFHPHTTGTGGCVTAVCQPQWVDSACMTRLQPVSQATATAACAGGGSS